MNKWLCNACNCICFDAMLSKNVSIVSDFHLYDMWVVYTESTCVVSGYSSVVLDVLNDRCV